MPISLPNLDDRTHADLMAEARAMIPALTPDWTNFNESDPGMTLVELLAWLAEMLIYQLDQVPRDHVGAFLALLGEELGADEALDHAIFRTIANLRQRYRLVTPADYEALVLRQFSARVRRVRCLPQFEPMPPLGRLSASPGHVTLVILTDPGQDFQSLQPEIASYLEPRRLLTVQHHLVKPDYLTVWLHIKLAIREDVLPRVALRQAYDALNAYFDPYDGGRDGAGWPFGRSVQRGDLYAMLDRLAGIDYVESLVLYTFISGDERREFLQKETVGIRLMPNELVKLDWDQMELVVVDPDGRELRWSPEEIAP